MQKIVGIIFILSWLLCGCTIETITEGGAPIFLISFLVLIGTALIISHGEK